jgi:hypothetical protein
MAIFILVFTLLMAFLAIALLLGIAPISSKAKSRTMCVGATLMIEEHRIITVHNKKTFVWTLEGEGIIGQLHYFGKVKESD